MSEEAFDGGNRDFGEEELNTDIMYKLDSPSGH